MKNTAIYKIFGIAIVIALFIFSIVWSLLDRSAGNNPATQYQDANPLSIPTGSGEVKIRDITKNPVQQTQGALEIEQQAKYSIVYYESDNSFVITLLGEPLKQVREQAEAAFLKNLNIQEPEACRLKVSLTIPFSVNDSLSGQDYGLSFCPNAKDF